MKATEAYICKQKQSQHRFFLGYKQTKPAEESRPNTAKDEKWTAARGLALVVAES